MSAIEDGAMQDKAGAQIDDLVKRLHQLSNDLTETLDYPLGEKFPLPNEAAAELTRLRERNAELDKEYNDAIEEGAMKIFEAETRIASLEATVREMREAAEPLCNFAWSAVHADCDEARVYLNKLVGDLRTALASSESVVGKSEGEKDGE